MVVFKSGQLSKKEISIITSITNDCMDVFGDAYITKNNLRLFLRENPDLLIEGIKKGDKIVYEEDKGFVYLFGWSDNGFRKYAKVLSINEDVTNRLLKNLAWNIKEDLYAKIKKVNPLKETLEKNGFRYFKDRGKEVLLVKRHFQRRANYTKGDK